MTLDLAKLRALCDGFRGRFFYDAERGDLAYIAAACERKECDCEPSYNADGDIDCSHSLSDWEGEDHLNEPLADMLNALPACLDEIERLRKLLAEACDLTLDAVDSTSDIGVRIRAIRAEGSGT